MSWNKNDHNLISMTLPPLGQDDEGEGPKLMRGRLMGEKWSQGVGASQHGGCIH